MRNKIWHRLRLSPYKKHVNYKWGLVSLQQRSLADTALTRRWRVHPSGAKGQHYEPLKKCTEKSSASFFVSFLSKCMAWVYTWGNAGKTQWEICTPYKLPWSRKIGKDGGTDSYGKEMKTRDSQKEHVLLDWSWTRKEEETLLGHLANSEWDMWIGRSCRSDIISWFGGLVAVM